MKVWLNGELVDADAARVSVRDHGLTVGDGVFETMKIVDGVPFALTRHLHRLQASGERLGLAVPDEDVLRAAAAAVIGSNEPGSVARLRITVTGGDGPPGTERADAAPTVLVVGGPLKAWARAATLVTVPWARNERSAIAGAKTTSYAENVVALAWAAARGADDALFLDTRGNLSETTGSNLFIVLGGRLCTPGLSTGCLAGVTRALVTEWNDCDEVEMSRSVLAEATEVFVTSSTRDVQPVVAVDECSYPGPGQRTTVIMEEFGRRSRAQLDP